MKHFIINKKNRPFKEERFMRKTANRKINNL